MLFLSLKAQSQKDSVDYYLKMLKSNETNPDSSIYFLNKAYQNVKNKYERIKVLRKTSKKYTQRGEQDSAYSKLLKVIEIKDKEKHCKTLDVFIYADLAYYYYYFNQFELSYDAILKAETLANNLTTEDIENYNYNFKTNLNKNTILEPIIFNLGTIAMDNNKFDRAEAYYIKSIKLLENKGKEQDIIDVKINLLSILFSRKKYDECIEAFIYLINEYKLNKSDLSLVYYNISLSYYELKKYSKSLEYINKSILLSESINDKVQLIDLYFHKSDIKHKQGHYEEERKLLDLAYIESKLIQDTQAEIDILKAYANNAISTKNYPKAVERFKKLNIIRDSLEELNSKTLFHNIELENSLLKQEKKNINQKMIIQTEKNKAKLLAWIIVLGSALMILMFFFWYISRKNNYKRLQLAEQQIHIQNIKSESKNRIMEMEQKRINEDLKAKKRELLMAIIQSKKRKEKLKIIIEEMNQVRDMSIIQKQHIDKLKKSIIKHSEDLDLEENIQKQLLNTHTGFFEKLLKDFPDLTKTELKILAYLRIGLTTKEIADIQYVSIDAIRKTRYRIRKKLNLEVKESLEKFLLNY